MNLLESGEATTVDDKSKEHMFDKVVTPSDVGKLNRLVIPKQYAEKYFPLDSSINEKGLLLSFEDQNGKTWHFRYSYWNSSQSYVMTKGWSRFVKEKKLDAGDIVSFQRGVGVSRDRLFIDWRRRLEIHPPMSHHFSFLHRAHSHIHPWSPLLLEPSPRSHFKHIYHNPSLFDGYTNVVANLNPHPAAIVVPQSTEMMLESGPMINGKAAVKRLRLFGVTMDCTKSESNNEECGILLFSSSASTKSDVLIKTENDKKGKSCSTSMSLDLEI